MARKRLTASEGLFLTTQRAICIDHTQRKQSERSMNCRKAIGLYDSAYYFYQIVSFHGLPLIWETGYDIIFTLFSLGAGIAQSV